MVKVRVRVLRIGAKEYRWTAELGSYLDTHRHRNRCVRLRVWGGGKNGRMLRADLIAPTDQGLWGDDPGAAYPTPGAVRAIIDYALDHGWEPAAIGGLHELRTGADLEIEGWRVTDQLSGAQHLRY